jgi:acyl-CoA thioester hydrolase
MEESTSILTLRIDWSELDLFGHVNNVVFYQYLQSARVRFWEQIGLYEMFEKERIAPLLASAKVDFKAPLYYPGNASIHYKPAFVKNTSFGLMYSVFNDKNETVALGEDAMVLYDFKENKKLVIPDHLRENIHKLR